MNTSKLLFFILLVFYNLVSFAQVDVVGEKKIELSIDGNTLKVPYYANISDVNQENTNIKRVIISMHGINRNADDYYDNMLAAAQMESTNLDTILIIAPQFLTEADIDSHSLDNEHLYWSSGGWPIGNLSRNNATNPRPLRISTFAVIDSLLIRLYKNMPNLNTIVLSGHSAGGQLVNRYSASTPIVDELFDEKIGIRFIVNNPSSYVYMDNKRRVAGTIDQFEVSTSACTTYNEYKYGLDDLPSYLNNIGIDAIRNQLEQREVVYLLGEFDNSTSSTSLDQSCQANLQGLHRLERGTIYFNHLKNYYGDDISNMHTIDTVPGIGHSNSGMFQSELGRFYTFRKPLINNPTLSINEFDNKKKSLIIYPNPTNNIINIKGVLATGKDTTIKLFNQNGKQVFFKQVNLNEQQVSLPYLSDGVYFISLLNDGKNITHKLIISN